MNSGGFGKPVEILLVEDNLADARVAQETFKEGRVPNRLTVVRSGEDALAYLRQQGEPGEFSPPVLILLDLKLPGKSSHEVWPRSRRTSACGRFPSSYFPPLTTATTSAGRMTCKPTVSLPSPRT